MNFLVALLIGDVILDRANSSVIPAFMIIHMTSLQQVIGHLDPQHQVILHPDMVVQAVDKRILNFSISLIVITGRFF
jgi:hypothetical protein